MPTLSLKSILAFGALAGASAVANIQSRQDSLQQYRTQIKELNKYIADGIKCYTEFVPQVKASNPPKRTVLKSIEKCNILYDNGAIKLRDAHRTAQARNFQSDKLHEMGLANVLDARLEHQGEYTRKLQEALQELHDRSKEAVDAFDAGTNSTIRVALELKKVAEEQRIDVSKAKIERKSSADGGPLIEVAGVLVAGVAVFGAITYGPFIEATTAAAEGIEALDTAIETATSHVSATQNAVTTDLNSVTIGQLNQARQALEEVSIHVEAAHDNVDALHAVLAEVPEAEADEANVVVHVKAAELNTAIGQYNNLRAALMQIRQTVVQSITPITDI
ncbi:hypothetical protein CDD83_127 [Cordyceps sp. RAO-2017]|nr:hypothetical protein CDD83_127 [Cordyceps sp. RAO-2017]